MSKTFRIGTRDSQLALWQATRVQHLLKKQGLVAGLAPVKSEGDLDLTTPLYAMGVQGLFTRSLDQALLNNQIDLAVHSMKDVPVQLPKGIVEAAVLERDSPFDLLVPRKQMEPSFSDHHSPATIASSSLRRKAQWLYRFPEDTINPIRGNVNTRLKKLSESKWNGAIFAEAGLERLGLRPLNAIELEWMLPAPAQGALLVVCREKDEALLRYCAGLNDERTAFCTTIERDFLSALMGGCSTPVGALAEIENEEIYFQGNLTSTDGKKQVTVVKRVSVELAASLGTSAAHELLANGAQELLQEIKND
jgi:hydroxymethylbilane synthase